MPQRTPSASPVKYFHSPHKGNRNRTFNAQEIRDHGAKFDKSLDVRNYPRRDVVHYESPPRRRLRETEDEAIKVYHQSKYTFNICCKINPLCRSGCS
jgi:hypothetical protein